jgi:hypothetical protein
VIERNASRIASRQRTVHRRAHRLIDIACFKVGLILACEYASHTTPVEPPEHRRHFFSLSRGCRSSMVAVPVKEAAMIEDTLFKHMRKMLKREHALPLQSCRVSQPVQRPWGRTYRLVEWSTATDSPSYRCVVPAEFTDAQIARLVASHVPGRVYFDVQR